MTNATPPAPTNLSPIRIADGTVAILDQALLPFREEWLELHDLEQAAHAIRSMQVRGAPLIGVTAACGVALGLQNDGSDAALEHAVSTLWATRPTAVNLHWAVEQMRALWTTCADTPEACAALLLA
ncbi:MAG: S-methyl-5-thioribose-1-phosphate isomerase, partial [Rhodocyclaceae bacterium]